MIEPEPWTPDLQLMTEPKSPLDADAAAASLSISPMMSRTSMSSPDDLAAEPFAYTLERGDATFVHQHALDALAAQRADGGTTPMQLTFAVVGLYLYVERGYTGRQVQQVHAALARRRPSLWPRLELPDCRGAITIADVMAAPAGPTRDAAIGAWCAAVWAAYSASRDTVVEFLRVHGVY